MSNQKHQTLLSLYKLELNETIKKRQMIWYTKKYNGKMEHIKDLDSKIAFLLEKISWERGKKLYENVNNEFSGLRRTNSGMLKPTYIGDK